MSIQFGRWNFDCAAVVPAYINEVSRILASHAPDDSNAYATAGLHILFQSFYTTKESRKNICPYISHRGTVFTWDGRLDNRSELCGEFGEDPDCSDVRIVARAYEERGARCFSELVGDWATAIWEPASRTLILAKDPIGTRHLYYSCDDKRVVWSTILDPLVLLAERKLLLEEEYIAGWLSSFPDSRLTPYQGIHSVPPSHFVRFEAGKIVAHKYWDFDPSKRIDYRDDKEYEEHFLSVFGQAVRCRLRSDRPILAELSGGMDSSSIVCMADKLADDDGVTNELYTISYYDDSEPNWNERPYFSKVEEQRGRVGCHINVASDPTSIFTARAQGFAATPASLSGDSEAARKFVGCFESSRGRVLLSGMGGDETLGGIPTPRAEISDLLMGREFRKLARQLKVWALNKRKPWFHILFEAMRDFVPPAWLKVPEELRATVWLTDLFIKRNAMALRGYPRRVLINGVRPSFQANLVTLEAIQRQLGCGRVSSAFLYEKRYPYLDRRLLEFLYAVPREQLVRPGQRRSLMRRALRGIVPEEILNRKQKAYVVARPMAAISAECDTLMARSRDMVSGSLGVVNSVGLCHALELIRQGNTALLLRVMRTLTLEVWLDSIGNQPSVSRALI